MPEHIRALLFVLVLGSFVWLMARPAITQIVSTETFTRWRGFWYVTTLAWFLSHNFWIYVGIMTVMLIKAGRRETHVFGLYLLLLVAAPPTAALIPGFGLINYVIELDHYRLLSLALLFPCAWRLSRSPTTIGYFRSPLDWIILAYLLLHTILAFRGGNFTSDARTALGLWIGFFLPYYVASRSIQSIDGFRHALVGLVLGGALLSALALFELLRGWKLYEAASVALGLDSFGAYKTRGGFIRPGVSIIDSIALGYFVVVAAGGYLYLQSLIEGRVKRWLGWLVLATGVIVCLSRGPWVGAFMLVFVFILISARPLKRLIQAVIYSSCIFLILSASPSGQKFLDLLPFVGQEEQGNVEYRANILIVSLPVIERNLLFGASNYLDAPELQVLRQGEGIIDIVNTFVGVALSSGIVGLLLFLGMFFRAMHLLNRGMRWAHHLSDADGLVLGRALFATVLSIILIIFTVSSILIVPTIYFTIIGLSCAYFLLQQHNLRVIKGSAWT